MKLLKSETHTVYVRKYIEIPDDHLIEAFGSVENATEAYEKWTDEWGEFIGEREADYLVKDIEDWWSEREGCVDIDWQIDKSHGDKRQDA